MAFRGKRKSMTLPLQKYINWYKKTKKGHISVVGVEYPRELHKKHNKLSFLAESMKIGNVEKLVLSLNDKKVYVVHSKNLNKGLKHSLKLKKYIGLLDLTKTIK